MSEAQAIGELREKIDTFARLGLDVAALQRVLAWATQYVEDEFTDEEEEE